MKPAEYLDAALAELIISPLVISFDVIEHYPELPGFPHHVHLTGGQVEPSDRLSILDVLQMLASEAL